MLDPDPKKRPTAFMALQYPWFSTDREALNTALEFNNMIKNIKIQKQSCIMSNFGGKSRLISMTSNVMSH